MQALDEHVNSFIQSCVTFASVSILAHSFFNRSSFASLQLFLNSRCNCNIFQAFRVQNLLLVKCCLNHLFVVTCSFDWQNPYLLKTMSILKINLSCTVLHLGYTFFFKWPKWQLFNVAGYLIRGEAQMACH